MDKYEKGEKLGQGQFGVVFKARHKETDQIVAIKKIHLGKAKEGINMTALREIKLLKELESPYIVRLLDVFPHKRNLSLVYEFLDSDLECLIRDRATIISAADVKSYMQMLLKGLVSCHKYWILHRDIKPNNFLISMSGEMKLADFGLARMFGHPEDGRFTSQVFTRWYRPPELLFGSTCYGPSVDIWAAGCVFAELLLRRAWFPGDSDLDQLGKIFQALGTPTEANWPGCTSLPQYVDFHPTPAQPLRTIFRQASEDALALLAQMVALDPSRRISAKDALAHPYFRNAPQPTPPLQLPKPPVRAHNPLKLPAKGSSILQAAPAVHTGPMKQNGSSNPSTAMPDHETDSTTATTGSKPVHSSAAGAASSEGPPTKRQRGPDGSSAAADVAREDSKADFAARGEPSSGSLGGAVSQHDAREDERRALTDIGFEAGPRPDFYNEDLRDTRKRKLDWDAPLNGG